MLAKPLLWPTVSKTLPAAALKMSAVELWVQIQA